jgi:DNA-binding response OmpR family regulator
MPTAPIAIVEDDPGILGFMQEALVDAGYAVVLWMSATGAQEMLVAAHPAAVVLDIGLEGPRAGLDVLQTMRARAETAVLPVLVCTADREFLWEQRVALREMGCETLAKPFLVAELLAAVADLVEARGVASSAA